MRKAPEVKLSNEEREELEKWIRARTLPARQGVRAQAILLAAEGADDTAIGMALGISRQRCGRIRKRFLEGRNKAMKTDRPRSGRPRVIEPQKIVALTTSSTPEMATDWSRTLMAKAAGISPSSVGRIWRSHGLKPHRVSSYKISNDPKFTEKLEASVGLYLSPPQKALVLCVDEKSQIQALDRTQPGLPLRQGRHRTQTHDYKRHGTTTLFAALNTLDGTVLSSCQSRHRHLEWLRFLKQIDAQTPADRELHLIVDNYATHKHAKVKAWLAKHPRIHLHFTPTSASWLNMVERFFRDLTTRRLRDGIFHSVAELEAAITAYIASHNVAPKPFIWTASASDILAKVARARSSLDKLPN
jgi:transposase